MFRINKILRKCTFGNFRRSLRYSQYLHVGTFYTVLEILDLYKTTTCHVYSLVLGILWILWVRRPLQNLIHEQPATL